jgi:hypothetical protein
MYNEYMTASDMTDSAVSLFTLTFLEDTGWYNINYDYADPLTFGYGEGCDFVNEACYG